MEPTESRTHSFIIKIWLEEEMDEAGRAVWRGHITHVSGGERQYIQDLGSIPPFIRPYLELPSVRSDSNEDERLD